MKPLKNGGGYNGPPLARSINVLYGEKRASERLQRIASPDLKRFRGALGYGPSYRPSYDSASPYGAGMTGYVYFIAPEALLHRRFSDALVKIGFTRGDPVIRLRALQTGSPQTLVLWSYIDGSESLERSFHEAFSNMRSHGEWFYAQYKLAAFLRQLGEEPNIGRFIPREQLEAALYDTLFNDAVPEDMDEMDWRSSCDDDYLAPHFHSIWSEAKA